MIQVEYSKQDRLTALESRVSNKDNTKRSCLLYNSDVILRCQGLIATALGYQYIISTGRLSYNSTINSIAIDRQTILAFRGGSQRKKEKVSGNIYRSYVQQ